MSGRLDFAVLAALLLFKLNVNLQHLDWGWDGGYYADVARNFAATGVLSSSISMYHEGFFSFPTPTPVYPLWPLTLGLVIQVLPLELAAVWLPTFFYFGAVITALALGRKLAPQPLVPALGIGAGHVAAVGLGLNDRFMEATSAPYTEGLAMFLLGLALLRAVERLRAPGFAAGGELGLWCAVLLCVRGPWVPLVGAFAVATLLPVFSAPVRLAWRMPSGFGLGFVGGMLPLAWWYPQVPGAELLHLVRFERWRVNEGLSHTDLLVPAAGIGAWLLDRWSGVVLAFTPPASMSWFKNFGLLLFAPIVAGVVGLRQGVILASVRRWLTDPAHHPALLVFGVGAAQALAIHGVHKLQGSEWNFPTRHGVPAYTFFLLPALWLMGRGPWPRAVATFLLCAAVGRGAVLCISSRDVLRMGAQERTLWTTTVRLLRSTAVGDTDLRVGATTCQKLVRFAPDLSYIDVATYTTAADLDWMVEHQGLDLLLLRTDTDAALIASPTLLARWQAVPDAPDGFALFTYEPTP